MHPPSFIQIRGARLHNLKNVNADFPVGQISVVCGPSGCGKSTLVLDVLHAESRRRYLETLSSSALQLLGGPRSIPVDAIHGLRPSIALESDPGGAPPKANVASLAEIAPILRVLWAASANPACPHCGQPMLSHNAQQLVQILASFPDGTRMQVLAPVPVAGRTLEELSRTYIAQGYTRSLADNAALALDSLGESESQRIPERFHIVVDRIIIKANQRTRLSEAIESALRVSGTHFEVDANGERFLYSTTPRCGTHGGSAPLLTPAHFSPWSPKGQCSPCRGSGVQENGALCPACAGNQLEASSRQARWKELSWEKLHTLPLAELAGVLQPLLAGLPAHLQSTSRDLLPRIDALQTLGLGYLSLGRLAPTLSSGELQRLRLAGLATGHLDGVLLCLDEPASGLHERDVEKLWSLLLQLKERGNTVILIEHHPAMIRRADWIIEMGPGAGEHGGNILFQGNASEFQSLPDSPTSQWIARLAHTAFTAKTKPTLPDGLFLQQARIHNLQNVSAHFPIASFTVLCGISGSGKSSLLWDCLAPLAKNKLEGSIAAAECGTLRMQGIEALAGIRAGSFGAHRRSSVATAVGLMTPLRELFSELPESKVRGYGPARFGTSSPGGRCETCKGEGVLRDPSGYEECECPVCQGSRYRDEILDIRFKTLSIAEVLECTVEKALNLFVNIPIFQTRLRPLADTGLSYLRLGQPTTHMSGGELQRLRLSLELGKAKGPRTLYLFDEPARGLHQCDIAKLLQLLRGLVEQGHTVIAIEHQLDFRLAADQILEMGPGAGNEGGRIL